MTAALAHRASGSRAAGRGTPGARSRRDRPDLKMFNQEAIRQRARRRNALLTLFIVVLLGFFVVAFVHAQLVSGQQELDDLRTDIAAAKAQNARLTRAVEEASSPAVVVGRAEGLGMVRAAEPVYLVATAPAAVAQPVSFSPDDSPAEPTTDVTGAARTEITVDVAMNAIPGSEGLPSTPPIIEPTPADAGTASGSDATSGDGADDGTQVITVVTAASAPVEQSIDQAVEQPADGASSLAGAAGSTAATAPSTEIAAPAPTQPPVAEADSSAATPMVEGVSTSIAGTRAVVGGVSASSGGSGGSGTG